MFASKMGHKNFALLGRMLDLHSAKQRVHAQNIANVNTPHYRRREFSFEASLRNAMSKGTHTDYAGIEGVVRRPNNTPVRNNGNNVDIDMEMSALSGNATAYQIYTELYSKKSSMVKMAIRGGA